VTIKLLWLPSRELYSLRVFAGPDPRDRPFVGELRLSPAAAVVLRSLIVAGDAAGGELVVSEAGWIEPQAGS